MPVFFIHGVNVRKSDPGFANGVTARNELLRRMVLQPLAATRPHLDQIQIVSPYWGDSGVSFHWDLASLPEAATEALEALGTRARRPSAADQITAETIAAIAYAPRALVAANGDGPLAPEAAVRGTVKGAAEMARDAEMGPLMRAARNDLLRLTESLMTPLFLAETELVGKRGDGSHDDTPDDDTPDEGLLQAQLAMAVYAVANDRKVKKQVQQAQSDQEVIDLLTAAVQARFVKQARADGVIEAAPARRRKGKRAEAVAEVEAPVWLNNAQESIGSLFGRALSAPVEAIATAFIANRREPIHRNIARFMGDIFVYLDARGELHAPGPIVATVLDALRATPKNHPDEPVIVITHSMGGNILYDLVTFYAPDLQIDAWISVGGQVAQFEEMKLFRKSDPGVGAPQKVAKPNVGYWLNVYDTADILSFRVEPVFDDVDADEAYATGASVLKAHGEYFGRASFYELVLRHLKQAL